MWCGREYFPIKETAAISPFPPICFCWPVEKLFVGSMYIYVCGLFIATKIWFNAEANIDRTCCLALYLEGDASKRTVWEPWIRWVHHVSTFSPDYYFEYQPIYAAREDNIYSLFASYDHHSQQTENNRVWLSILLVDS